MAETALEFAYRYPSSSGVFNDSREDRRQLVLATDHRFSFSARIVSPTLFADSLLCLSNVVRSNFAYPSPSMLDPVVSCGPGSLRFEGFSGCCGLYAVAKFLEPSFEASSFDYGTTNVDFNDGFRNGLATLRSAHSVSLEVSQETVRVTSDQAAFIEKKVKLPLRWLRGFCEVQDILSRVEHRCSCSSREVRKFILGLPRNAARRNPLWATPTGSGLRASARPSAQAVPIIGADRLRLLEPLLRAHDGTVSIGTVPGAAISSWFCELEGLQFLLVLSSGLHRGFSGEGQVLTRLADQSWQNAIDQVRNSLNWEQPLEVAHLATRLNLPNAEVANSLAALATRGVLGFDLHQQQYFYRVLPFESELVESLQPRLTAARQIVEDQDVTPDETVAGNNRWTIRGGDVQYIVELGEERSTCTCVWFNKHQNSRGPCKHILAAMIHSGRDL